MKNIMKKAWEIYRTLTGDHIAKLSMALRMAWQEAKNMVKTVEDEIIEAVETIISESENARYDYEVVCRDWQNYGKDRTYIKVREIRKYDGREHGIYDFGYIDNQTNTYVPGKMNANVKRTISGVAF